MGKTEIPIDQHILNQINQYIQVDLEQTKAMILNNKHNSVTSTYYLMLLKHIRNGGYSIADLRFYKPTPIQKSDSAANPKQLQAGANETSANSDNFSCNPDNIQKISGTGGSNELEQIVQSKIQKFAINNNKEIQNLNNSLDI